MKDAASVMTTATDGIVSKLAERREISVTRMHEILGKDNPYPKTKVLIRDIGEIDASRVRIIKADIDAMFADVLGEGVADEPSVKNLHKEAFEAIDAQLDGKPVAEQLKELRDLAAVVNQMIEGREKLATPLRIA